MAYPSPVDENPAGRKKPHAVARFIALEKARAVAGSYPENWVLGVDTIVVLKNGRITGKPADEKEARKILDTYRGSYCDVYSGIALVHQTGKKTFTGYEKTRIYFRDFTEKDIGDYLKKETRWKESSGAMTIEGIGGRWLKRMEGDYWNVVGLPVKKLKSFLAEAGEL